MAPADDPTRAPPATREADGDGEAPVDQAAQTVRAWELAATVRGSPGAGAGPPGSTPRIRARPSRSLPVAEAWAEHTADPPADPAAFPVPNWDRYEPIRLLGEGGMGRVFLARDLKLDRHVAIKFVRGDDPELVHRIMAEARAQARVVDDRVCQVFDVGEIAGRVYIAMQAIDGKTLSELSRELTFEQKVMVLRGAALGVNEAHRVGLIHRDLKPSNIMVERSADGELRPYVMDFGVARDWADDATATGTVLGTPHYMAPEQARGEVKQLDRRADVYSLGATLYTVLVDRPPITGDNPLVVLNRISVDEPVRPRAIDPDVPADLEAIVMKCLEKERAARYDSARALADDLGRFLGGEPVLARGALGLRRRTARFLRKHWRLVALATVVLGVVAVALGFAVNERLRSARREELARRFTERVERIDALARTSALAPPHDVRADRALIEREMESISALMRAEGSVATAAGHYALGRGHLALGDDLQAEQELQLAWKGGFRDARAAYALALAQGRLYQRGVARLDALPDQQRAGPKAELERRYRDPALRLLGRSVGAGIPREHVGALIAYNEERHDDALRQLDAIDLTAGGMASIFEVPRLRGRVLHRRALERARQGKAELAAADLEAARRAFADALRIAESDPFIQVDLAMLEERALVIELYGSGAVDGPFERGVAAADRALAILPDLQPAFLVRAQLHRKVAVHRARRGLDVDPLLASALADAGRAVELAADPEERDEAGFELAEVYRSWGEVLQGQHRDPGDKLAEALKVAEARPAAARDAPDWNQLGLIHSHWADYQDEVGAASTEHRDQAIAAYEHATSHDRNSPEAWLNLSRARFARSRRAAGADADRYLEGALDALAQGERLDADNLAALAYHGEVQGLIADRKEARDVDPRPDREAAIAAYERALALSPDEPVLRHSLANELHKQAAASWERGGDPDPFMARAREEVARTIAASPDDPNGHNNLADGWVQQAEYDHARGRDARPATAAARAGFERAHDLLPGHPIILLNLAALDTVVAEHDLDRGRDPRPALARARARLERASSHPHPEARRVEGAVAAIAAGWQSGRRVDADAGFAEAVRAYGDAIAAASAITPDLPAVQQLERELATIELAWARTGAGRGDAGPALASGLTRVERLLAARPSWPAARALRGAFLLVRARASADAVSARADAARAAADLRDALAANPNLAGRWGADATQARKLAGP